MIGRRFKTPAAEADKPKGFDDFELRLGDLMRGERATLGKSLLDIQRELKIKATFIAAIENADVSAFETPGFIAGNVRSYARYLGMDPDWAFAKFCREANFEVAHGMSAAASSASMTAMASSSRPAAAYTGASLGWIATAARTRGSDAAASADQMLDSMSPPACTTPITPTTTPTTRWRQRPA